MQIDQRTIRQDFHTNSNHPTMTEQADGVSVYVRADWNTAEFVTINDDSPVDTAYMLTPVRIMSNRIPGVHLTAQVEGGKYSEVLNRVKLLIEQLEK